MQPEQAVAQAVVMQAAVQVVAQVPVQAIVLQLQVVVQALQPSVVVIADVLPRAAAADWHVAESTMPIEPLGHVLPLSPST